MSSVKTMPKEAKNKKSTSSKMSHKKDSKPKTLSTEYIQESESEDDGQSDSSSTSDDDSLPENPAASTLKKKTQAKKPVSDSSSSSGSESESESGSGSGSGSGSESESESESSSGESEKEQVPSRTDKKKEAASTNGSRHALKVSSTTAVAVEKPFVYSPPSGFEPASINEAQRISQLLKGSNIEGKEIWYITAPASVPLSSIEGLSLLAVKERKKILSYKGDDYAFASGASEVKASTKVMVPNTSDGSYRTGKIPISRSLHLQQTIPRAKFISKVTTPAKNPVRPQPLGLRMRYCPIGFETEQAISGSSDQEMPDAPAAKFQKAGSISSSSEDEDMNANTVPPSKSGKKSKTPTDASTKAGGRPEKRKRSDEEKKKKKSKHSSSRSASITDDRKLKRIKPQVESQKTTNSQPPSTEPRPLTPTILPPKPQTTSRILPPSLGATKPKTVIAHPRASLTTSAEPPTVYSQALAMDPDLTAKERRKEAKKLKKNRDGFVPETKQSKEKAVVSSQPSSSQLTSYDDQMASKGGE